jgi:hypothetical protein
MGTDSAVIARMDAERRSADDLDAIDGADDGALGTAPPPQSAPTGAQVSDAEHLVPGATFDDDRHAEKSKPWFTSLAAESHQAGVGNDRSDAQEPMFPAEDDDPR